MDDENGEWVLLPVFVKERYENYPKMYTDGFRDGFNNAKEKYKNNTNLVKELENKDKLINELMDVVKAFLDIPENKAVYEACKLLMDGGEG